MCIRASSARGLARCLEFDRGVGANGPAVLGATRATTTSKPACSREALPSHRRTDRHVSNSICLLNLQQLLLT